MPEDGTRKKNGSDKCPAFLRIILHNPLPATQKEGKVSIFAHSRKLSEETF
jgi:hypothetical protein